MAVTHNGNRISGPCGEDLSAKEFFGGTVSADGEIVLGRSGDCLGGLRIDRGRVGDTGTIQHHDVIQAVAGAAVAIKDAVTTDADGAYIPSADGNSVGVALSSATAPTGAGDDRKYFLFTLLITPGYVAPTP